MFSLLLSYHLFHLANYVMQNQHKLFVFDMNNAYAFGFFMFVNLFLKFISIERLYSMFREMIRIVNLCIIGFILDTTKVLVVSYKQDIITHHEKIYKHLFIDIYISMAIFVCMSCINNITKSVLYTFLSILLSVAFIESVGIVLYKYHCIEGIDLEPLNNIFKKNLVLNCSTIQYIP